MATTIESLRKLGLKVNGTEPTNNNIGNVINEIADDYAGGSGSAGVSSIGGVDGAITLGTGLSMSGQELQVSASGGNYIEVVDINIDGATMGEDSSGQYAEVEISEALYNKLDIDHASSAIAIHVYGTTGDFEGTNIMLMDTGDYYETIQFGYNAGDYLEVSKFKGDVSGGPGYIPKFRLSMEQYQLALYQGN